MVYTPQLSIRASVTLRRLAWLRSESMTVTIEIIIKTIAEEIETIKPGAVCGSCKDNGKCSICFIQEHKLKEP